MRVADPVNHVELRRNQHGHESVVFAFPYRPDIVDAVRAIPGRRFDWQAKEWWAPRADATAAYVQGVIERFPELEVAPDVATWLARAVKGWVGRMTAARRAGAGWFVLDGIAGELPDPLAAVAESRGERQWLPFTQEVADALLELAGARMDPRALRCATKLQVGLTPAPATLSLVESYGEPRFKLDVNWDPDVVGAFVELPAAEAHGRTVPLDPYLLEPLEHFLRLHGIDVGQNAQDGLDRLRIQHDAAIGAVRRSRASDGDVLSCEPRLGGELRPFQRAGVAYALEARRLFIADEQGLGKTIEALATLEQDDAYPAVVICPASLKLNWERETAHWLPHRSLHVVVGTGKTIPKADITVLELRDRAGAPRAAFADEAQGADPRRVALRQESGGQAHQGRPPARRVAARGRAEDRAHRHAGHEPPGRADRPAADPRPARGVRVRRALQAPLPGRRRRGAHPLAPAAHVLRPAAEEGRAPAAAGEAPGRGAGRARERARVPARRTRRRRLAAGATARSWPSSRASWPRPCAPSAWPSSTRCDGWPRAASSARRWPGSTTSWPPRSRSSSSPATARSRSWSSSASRKRCTSSAPTRPPSATPPCRPSRTPTARS